MSRIRKAIAAIIKDRKELGLIKQKDLAHAMQCSQAFVSEMLSGDRRMSSEMVERFCDALGVTLSDLEQPRPLSDKPKEVSEYACKLEKLYELQRIPGFRSVTRNIDEWLQVASSINSIKKEHD